MKNYISLLFIILLVSCNTVRVNYDYDKDLDFTAYTTYGFYRDMNTGLNDLDTKRLLNAIEDVMRTKGFKLAEEPELYINVTAQVYKGAPSNSVGVGLGGGGNNIGGGLSVGVPIGGAQLQREITFDFIDVQRDALVWQAVSVSGYKENQTPEAKELKLLQIVEKALSKYPSKVK
ncbi:hypothetical protein A5M85_11085 [Cellulophaga lytica]|uniref:DUF4136 domain-containing protein n=1 Tax=Cellulophaga lytica TaxID=979 RepID=UPI0009504F88|nr:DUF4136 domain-containing protein [Cellulophaga lytica]APU10803.1 hypothetical protein A5M85_11085 [Cellulophaga lytica]